MSKLGFYICLVFIFGSCSLTMWKGGRGEREAAAVVVATILAGWIISELLRLLHVPRTYSAVNTALSIGSGILFLLIAIRRMSWALAPIMVVQSIEMGLNSMTSMEVDHAANNTFILLADDCTLAVVAILLVSTMAHMIFKNKFKKAPVLERADLSIITKPVA